MLAQQLATAIEALPAPVAFTAALSKLPAYNQACHTSCLLRMDRFSWVCVGLTPQEKLDKEEYVVILMPTWTDGVAPESAAGFAAWLTDAATDFRVSKGLLAKVKFAAFGLGDSSFGKNFCRFVPAHLGTGCRGVSHVCPRVHRAVRQMDEEFVVLGAERLASVGFGDDSTDYEAGASCCVLWQSGAQCVELRACLVVCCSV